MLMLFAQDVFNGGLAGWSSFGIAGLVLGWLLLKHLPDKDRQIRELIDLHLKTEIDQRNMHASLEREQRADFRVTLEGVMIHWNKQIDGITSALRTDLLAIQKAVEAVGKSMGPRP